MKRRLLVCLWPVLLAAPEAFAQRALGPAECTKCHKHAVQKQQWEVAEPARLGARAHFNTLVQLSTPKAAEYAKRAGLDGPRNARCVRCHATTLSGRPRAGVSCETCHGPGTDYVDPHQQPNAYAASVQKGMRDLRDPAAGAVKTDAIARLCVDCHVTADKDLRAAGHPVGEKFDLGASLRKIEHWRWEIRQTAIDYAAMTRIGAPFVQNAVARAGGASLGPAAAAAPAPVAAPAKAQAQTAVFDPDAAVDLPADYVEPLVREAIVERPRAANLGTVQVAPGQLAAPRVTAELRAARTSRIAEVARLRGETLALALRLRQAGLPSWTPPPPAEYAGPDGELLRLQDEALALLLSSERP